MRKARLDERGVRERAGLFGGGAACLLQRLESIQKQSRGCVELVLTRVAVSLLDLPDSIDRYFTDQTFISV